MVEHMILKDHPVFDPNYNSKKFEGTMVLRGVQTIGNGKLDPMNKSSGQFRHRNTCVVCCCKRDKYYNPRPRAHLWSLNGNESENDPLRFCPFCLLQQVIMFDVFLQILFF